MTNILNGLFKKGTEMEKLQGELTSLTTLAQELQTKINQVNNALVIAQAELMVDDTATNKKKVEKFQKAIEGFSKELEVTQAKAQEIEVKLSELNMEKRKAELEEVTENDLKGYKINRRSIRLRKEIEGLTNKESGLHTPRGLLKAVGVEYFEGNNPAHAPYIELWDNKAIEINEQVEKELEELMIAIKKFLNEV